ncbi:helix-turn-helix domain-containing protein [uncultured Microbulbifer sp.]|uniref:helix-turn-helix domain-containing protein n=1 Tax=uncultured Microbulbifer sp. TaxID=348147 RepID=UPI00260DF152|nr:helix-turn-helix domain-containing protein [uncultured Microbulbifer sp.]
MESLGSRLKLIRAGLRWSQTESARKVGIEQSYLSKLESGQALPSADCLERICEVYGADVQELLAGLNEQLLRRKPELLALRQPFSERKPRTWSLWRVEILGLAAALVFTCFALVGKFPGMAEPEAPEHELLSMQIEQVDGRKVIEMFAEYGGLKVSGIELVHGEIDSLQLDQVPWDIALTEVAKKLNLRVKISGGYVTLAPLGAELEETIDL